MLMLWVTGLPPLLIVAVTSSLPLFCARLSNNFPSTAFLITAMLPQFQSTFKSPAPLAFMAARLLTCGTISIAVRPSHAAGALSVNAGSAMSSLMVIAMSLVLTSFEYTALSCRVNCLSPSTRPASRV